MRTSFHPAGRFLNPCHRISLAPFSTCGEAFHNGPPYMKERVLVLVSSISGWDSWSLSDCESWSLLLNIDLWSISWSGILSPVSSAVDFEACLLGLSDRVPHVGSLAWLLSSLLVYVVSTGWCSSSILIWPRSRLSVVIHSSHLGSTHGEMVQVESL